MKIPLNRLYALALVWVAPALSAMGAVVVAPTTDANVLAAALNPRGLTITGASIEYGSAGQFGTYSNFNLPPITISNGIVLSSGDVSHVGDPPDPALVGPEPSYIMDLTGFVSSPEFDTYGFSHITNFYGGYDVAGLRVDFHLTTNSPVKFDFVFGSVEYPFWTSEYTDALLVFLDGTNVTDQITFDGNGQPVQVGLSFARLVQTADQNTAFANPHGMIGRLTTTTTNLAAGNHTLRFEVADVNDQILDSATFIANLRAGGGTPGTILDEPPELAISGLLHQSGHGYFLLNWTNNEASMILESASDIQGPWNTVSGGLQTNGSVVSATITNNAVRQFFRLREP